MEFDRRNLFAYGICERHCILDGAIVDQHTKSVAAQPRCDVFAIQQFIDCGRNGADYGVAGMRTTYGAPEFGARASTFNDIFGKTRNPWNLEKSVAGSSGGLAAALLEAEIGLAARLPLDPRPGRTGL